ncbi:MAG: AsmA-like C-terminal region-containing protein [Gemmataceae bacterium]
MGQGTAARPRRRFARLFTRSLAALLVLAAVSAGVGFHYWTDPVTVRRLVLERLRLQFPGAEVALDSARVWPGWGIAVTNLTLCRRDDPSFTPVLQVPTGRIEADAAQLARGRLRVRRVKLERARITAVCDRDGKWNLDGLLAPPLPNLPLPTVVLEHGTLVLRVATPHGGESIWEMDGARAALLEDRPGLAHFECRGESSRLGPLNLEGAWRRHRGEIDLAIDLCSVPMNLDLVHELARFAPLPVESVRHCSGVAHVHLDAHRRPEEKPVWQPEWRLGLTNGKLGLRELPLDLDAMEIDARIADGKLVVKEAHAKAGNAPVHATLAAKLPIENPADAIESATLSVEHLLVTPELFARLPERAQRFHQRFAPVGRMSADYRFTRRKQSGWDAHFELKPENIAGRYHKFPYPLRQVRGIIASELASDHAGRHHVDVSCEMNGGGRATMRGTVTGDEPHPEIDLCFAGPDGTGTADVDVDEDVITALPPKFQTLARSFHVRGKCAFRGRIHRPAGQPAGHDQYVLRCHDVDVCYEAFPIQLERTSGQLDIHLGPGMPDDPNTSDHWVLHNVTASHGGGRLAIEAHDEISSAGKRLVIDVGGQQVPLREPIASALAKYRMGPVWELLSPTGNVDFTSRLTLTDRLDGAPDAEITLGTSGANLRPAFFPFALTDMTAHLHSAGGRVLLGECTARHGETTLRFSGGEVRTQQGLWIDLRNIVASALSADQEFVRALPATLQRACASLEPRGTFGVDVKRLVYYDPPAIPGPPGPPVLYWDGSLALNDVDCDTGVTWTGVAGTIACRGSVRGNRLEWLNGHTAIPTAAVLQQPLRQLHAQLLVEPETPDVLQIRGVTGKAYGGDLTGEARIIFGSGLDYAMDVKLLGAQLQDFGQQNKLGEGRLNGKTTAQLYLAGRGMGLDELTGRGEIDVPSGKIYDLPLLLELLKATTLRAPDGVAFDEAHAVFKIQGRRMVVERVDLLGTAVSLGGHGAMDLNGEHVDLDFYAVWARIAQVLPVGLREVPPWMSQQLLKIKMHGSLAKPTFAAEPVPFVVDPVRHLLERVQKRNGHSTEAK